MARKTTDFIFFKDTPLIDFQNTIHFESDGKRDLHFLHGNHYDTLEIEDSRFNYIRDRSTLTINVPYEEFQGVNYCTFFGGFEADRRYYAYVMEYEYINNNSVKVFLLIDAVMTFTQGDELEDLKNINIQRQHLSQLEYNAREWELKNNDDILETHSKSYFHENEFKFQEYDVLIQSSADLTSEFGNEDDPKIRTSTGITFDKLTSPVNLYVVKEKHFKTMMTLLTKYAWITQNIKKVMLLPADFFDEQYEPVETQFGFNNLNVLKNNGTSNAISLQKKLNSIGYSQSELYDLFEFDEQTEKHLLRNEYTTAEVYPYNAQQLFIDLGQLNKEDGIKWHARMVLGYANEVSLFLKNYRIERGQPMSKINGGAFLNDSIIFEDFDEIPILVDNFQLGMARGANRRELAESKQITNRVGTIADTDSGLKEKFFDATSILSNVSPMNMFGKFQDEYEFYRTQKAEFADLALDTPTITNQSTSNGLQMANSFFGFSLKFSRPTTVEMNRIKKYYNGFGFEINEKNTQLDIVNSQSIANYLQFTGSWFIPNIDVALNEMMKAQFENGVRFWHDNETANPMNQDLINNTIFR